MNNSDNISRPSTDHTSALNVLELLKTDEHTPTSWRQEDAGELLRHQLAAALEFDLSPEHPNLASERAKQKQLEAAKQGGIVTFEDLFTHPNPPVEVLKLAKNFFKKTVEDTPKNSPENEVAHVCYYLSIAVAQKSVGERISNLNDAQLTQGFDWVARREWVDKETKALLKVRQFEAASL